MANEFVLSAVTGLSPLVQLYNGAISVGAPIAMTEIGGTGEYIADMPLLTPAAKYIVLIYVAPSTKITSGEILWDGSYEYLESLHKIQGLDPNNPMTVTPNTRDAGDINLVITGDGVTTTTVTKT